MEGEKGDYWTVFYHVSSETLMTCYFPAARKHSSLLLVSITVALMYNTLTYTHYCTVNLCGSWWIMILYNFSRSSDQMRLIITIMIASDDETVDSRIRVHIIKTEMVRVMCAWLRRQWVASLWFFVVRKPSCMEVA